MSKKTEDLLRALWSGRIQPPCEPDRCDLTEAEEAYLEEHQVLPPAGTVVPAAERQEEPRTEADDPADPAGHEDQAAVSDRRFDWDAAAEQLSKALEKRQAAKSPLPENTRELSPEDEAWLRGDDIAAGKGTFLVEIPWQMIVGPGSIFGETPLSVQWAPDDDTEGEA
jgi:hypothetical protein